MQEIQALNPASSVFAITGKTCPGGSEPYKGPEQASAAESGVIYCVLHKQVTIYPRKAVEKCPAGSKPYDDAKGRPDSDVIWCKVDLAQVARPPSGAAPASPAIALAPPAPVLAPPAPVMAFSGEMVRADSDTLVLKNISGPFGFMPGEKSYHARGAEMVEQTPKDPKKLQVEQEDYMKNLVKTGARGLPPQPFEEKKISASALKAGDRVNITSEIKDGKETVTKVLRTSGPPVVASVLQTPASASPPAKAPPTPPVTPAASEAPKKPSAESRPVKAEDKPANAPLPAAPVDPEKKKGFLGLW